jgi:hypothetical protein
MRVDSSWPVVVMHMMYTGTKNSKVNSRKCQAYQVYSGVAAAYARQSHNVQLAVHLYNTVSQLQHRRTR